jgi:hypothetical protein
MSAAHSCRGAVQALLSPQSERFQVIVFSAEIASGVAVKRKPIITVKGHNVIINLFLNNPFPMVESFLVIVHQ